MPRKSEANRGIPCPKCQSFTWKVADHERHEGYIWRRLKCVKCGERITTTERPALQAPPTPTAIYGGVLESAIGQLLSLLPDHQRSGFPSDDPSR